MKRLRLRAIVLTVWLIIFYFIAHIWAPLNLSPFAYIYGLVVVIVSLTTPRLVKIHQILLFTVPVILFLVFKALLNLPLAGDALPITIIETLAIVITMMLLLWVHDGINEFENTIASLTLGSQEKEPETPKDGQSILYREVRRARNHQRPLAILAIGVDETSLDSSIDRLMKDAQQHFIKQFALANVSRTLCEKLEDCDIVVQAKNHFLVILPETRPEDLPGLIERLRSQIESQVRVDLKIGSASLPQDSFTLEGLVEKATYEMQGTSETSLFIESEQLYINNKTK